MTQEKFTHSNEGGLTRVIATDTWSPADLSEYLRILHDQGLPLQKIMLDLSAVDTLPDIVSNVMYKGLDENKDYLDIVREIIFIGSTAQLEGLIFPIIAIPEISSGASVARATRLARAAK